MPPVERDDYAHVAQLVEHFLGKEEVTDSSSVMGYLVPIRTWLRQDSNDGQGLCPCTPGGWSYSNLALPGLGRRLQHDSIHSSGEVPEWLKGADCKSAGSGLRGFESLSHQSLSPLWGLS